MSEAQPNTCPDPWADRRYWQMSLKEQQMVQEENPVLSDETDGNIGRGVNLHFDQPYRKVAMTLTHAACYERNQTGTRLTHNLRYERNQKLCRANEMF